MININSKKIEELLTRGVEESIDKNHLKNKLESGKQLRIKLGIDPTSSNIHIGRAVPLLKLKDFQELGHKIILIIGNFTGIIGDTSDKNSERPMLTENQVEQNMKTYVKQAEKIIDIDKCDVCYNGEWLSKLDYHQISKQADTFSLNEFISRENIKKRLDIGKRVSLRELLYPLMQGYDSVAVKADVEIGGTDQRFNLLTGRTLQKYYNQVPQDIILNPLIEGLDGRKMSSSWGNTVNLLDSPNDMFGKIMSLRDEFIIKYFILTTRVKMHAINDYKDFISEGGNPRDLKMKLAFEIVKMYFSKKEAEIAQKYFVNTFSKKEIPKILHKFKPNKYDILSVLIDSKLVISKAEAKRVIIQNGVKVNGEVIKDIYFIVSPGSVLQKGKINFISVL